MTLNEYIGLDKPQQVKRFWNGQFVGKRFEGQSLVECRQIDGFYVEYKIFEKETIDLRCFQNPDMLYPYLGDIDISSVLLECFKPKL